MAARGVWNASAGRLSRLPLLGHKGRRLARQLPGPWDEVVSHESALVLHGISDVSPSRIQLSVLRDNHPRGAGESCTACIGGRCIPRMSPNLTISVTTVQRTIRDCLADGTDPTSCGSRSTKPRPEDRYGAGGRGVACRDRRSFSKHARMTSRYGRRRRALRALRDRLTAAAKRGGRDLRPTSAACRRSCGHPVDGIDHGPDGHPLLLVKGGASLEPMWYSAVALSKDDTVIRGDMESVHDRLGKR